MRMHDQPSGRDAQPRRRGLDPALAARIPKDLYDYWNRRTFEARPNDLT